MNYTQMLDNLGFNSKYHIITSLYDYTQNQLVEMYLAEPLINFTDSQNGITVISFNDNPVIGYRYKTKGE